MVLERAKEAPLSIVCTRSRAEYSYGKPHMESLYEMLGLFQNLYRVQSLQMVCERPFVDALKVALPQPAPLLEHLDLNAIMPISGSFPEVPFGGQAPRLRHLALRNWQLPPASLSIPGLRYLYLGSVKASLQSLMRLLSALPNLESLQVLDCMFPERGTPDLITGSTHVELSSLRSLDVTDNAASVVGLMQHLSANSITRLQLVCKRSSGGEILNLLNSDVISSQLSRLKQHFTIARLTDSVLSHGFMASTASSFNYDEECQAASLLSILVGDTGTGDPLLPAQFDTFSAVLSRLGTLCLRILRVATDCSSYPPFLTDKAVWLRAFPFPQTIREVQLVGSVAAGLIDALGHVDGPSTVVRKRRGKGPAAGRAKDATRPAAPRLFFGELHTLRVQDVDFRKKLRTLTLRQLFRQRLKMRAIAGAPLGCLQVFDCKGFSEEDKEDVDSGEWAESVDWDGIFDSDDDSDDNNDDYSYVGHNDDWCSDCGDFHWHSD
jgi:hypothetical protein